MAIMAVVLLAILLLPFVAALAVWSLNTLFSLGIPYTWQTLVAALVLGALVGGSGRGGK